jgi:hypothetical protein
VLLDINTLIEYSSIVIYSSLLYMLIFNLSFYFDNIYLSENTLTENLLENRKFYSIYSILMLIILIIIILLC